MDDKPASSVHEWFKLEHNKDWRVADRIVGLRVATRNADADHVTSYGCRLP